MKALYLYACILIGAAAATAAEPAAGSTQAIPYGNFDQWVTRQIKESNLLGGDTKTVYAIGPTQTIVGAKPYKNQGGSPWATSNVLASPMGIVKTSNAVYPEDRPGHGKCARLTTGLEHCKVLGMINMEVMVAGSIFLGEMQEPIKSTKNPYSKMDYGMPFTGRPRALQFDYKVLVPPDGKRIYSSGFGSRHTYDGADQAEVIVMLQRRWEDADGKLYAKRVGTARERYSKSTSGWVNNHKVPIIYGDPTGKPGYHAAMGLLSESHSYYARNSKGKLVPVREVGWDTADAKPTHAIVMFSSGSGDAYTGTPGLTLWVDEVAWEF